MPITDDLLNGKANQRSYAELERQRRLDLSRLICLASMGVLVLSVPVLLLRYRLAPEVVPTQFKILNFAFIAIAFAFFAASYILIERQQMGLSLVIIILTPLVSATGYQVIAVEQFGMNGIVTSVFGAYLIMIAFAGILGSANLIRASLVLAIVITLGLCLWLPQPHFDLGHGLTMSFSLIIQQAVMALITIAASFGFHRVLNELSDTRDAYQHALQLNELKDQFISSVNHELRNSLSVVLGNLELLSFSTARMDREEMLTYIAKANRMSESIHAQLSTILNTGQLDLGTTDFRPEMVDVQVAIGRAVEMQDPRAIQDGRYTLRVNAPEGLVIWGETVRLQQILSNLISNAIKYSSPDTLIEIAAVPYAGNKSVEITVRDYGLGIPLNQQDLVFERFVRLAPAFDLKIKGNGLGLYLCRILTQALGGKIWVESAGIPGEGSTFHLVLPVPVSEQVLATTKKMER